MLKPILFFSLILGLLASPSHARNLRCHTLLKASESPFLVDIVADFYRLDLTALRSEGKGRWVELNNGSFVRYELYGSSGPIRVHFEGLGGEVSRTLESRIVKQHLKRGRVLVVELEGQGLREVHQRIQRMGQGLDPTRSIEYNDNVKFLRESLDLIFKQENIKAKDIEVWDGHSFGGLTLSGLSQVFGEGLQSPLLQFIATGVANFNHRFVSSLGNIQMNFWGSFLAPQTGTLVKTAAESFAEQPLFSKFKGDPVRLESAVALTLGAKSVDIVKDATEYPPGTKVQIFTGQKDTVVFSMMHWELGMATMKASLPTTMVMVEKAGHYLPTDMTTAQARTYDRMTKNPDRYSGFYHLKTNGKLAKLSPEKAIELYKESSLEAWGVQRPFIEEIFSSMGQRATYPESWQ